MTARLWEFDWNAALILAGIIAGTLVPLEARAGLERLARSRVERLVAQEAERPTDLVIKRNLGIALYCVGRTEEARTKLAEVLRLRPDDGASKLFLGLSHEAVRDTDAAIAAFKAYVVGRRITDTDLRRSYALEVEWGRAEVRRHVLELEKARWGSEIARRLENRRFNPNPASIAAIPFHVPYPTDTLRALAYGLPSMITTDLIRVPSLEVIEFEHACAVTSERERPGGVGPGRLLGVRRFVGGTISQQSQSVLVLEPQLVSVEEGSAIGIPVKPDPIIDALSMEKAAIKSLLGVLNIPWSAELEKTIGSIPRRSFAAFFAYSQGIWFEQRGSKDLALRAYKNATYLDPSFHEAAMRHDRLHATDQLFDAHVYNVAASALDPFEDRLARSAVEIGLKEARDIGDFGSTPSNRASLPPIVTSIQGTLPR